MTKNGIFKTIWAKAILVLTVLCLILTSASIFSACGKDDEETESSSISYPSASRIEDEDNDKDILIKNGGFEYGSYNISTSSFPISSGIKGWSIATDNNAPSSNITSLNKGGIVDKDNWDTTLEKFLKSSSFTKILTKTYGEQKESSNTDYAKQFNFDKDSVFEKTGENEYSHDRVLMLNSYTTHLGSAVKTTSNAITLDKGAFYQIDVNVMTANLTFNKEEGANIRLVNSINGTSQEVAGIFGIDTEGAWEKYTLYVKADDEINCSITLVLGLGRGGDGNDVIQNCIQGTAFFDDISIKKLEKEPDSYNETKVEFGETNSKLVNANDLTDNFLYNMDVDLTPNELGDFSNYQNSYDFVSGACEVNENSYMFLSFTVDTKDFDKDDIYGLTVYVLDKNKEKTQVANFKYSDESKQTCNILIKNNFPKEEGYGAQSFSLNMILGATDGSTYLPSKSVLALTDISKITYREGEIDTDDAYYNLVSSLATGTVSLYAGYSQDYTDPSEETYTFTASKNVGEDDIKENPISLDGWNGINSDSVYVHFDAVSDIEKLEKFEIDKKVSEGTAGLINSAYLESADCNYKNLKPLLTIHKTLNNNKNIQPLFITNDNESYGFYSDSQKTVSTGSYANVSLKVRVCDDAKAFIYVIDLDTMEPMEFTFGEKTNKLMLKLTKEDMIKSGDNEGWALVNFFIATGNTEKKFKVELWNGSRDGQEKSTGTVFFDDVSISTSASNFESERYEDMFVSGTLGKIIDEVSQEFTTELYTRPLTDTEKQFNKEYPEKTISYRQNYIWADSNVTVYAVYNTIDPVESDPYASITEEEDTDETKGCATDSSTFWFSFSSIVLVAALIIALIALIIRRNFNKRKRNANDAKSHYKVKSRYNYKKDEKKQAQEEKAEETKEEPAQENVEQEKPEETVEETPETEEVKEEKLDDYVYGDVQNFGEELETNEEKPEETKEEAPETTEEVKEEPSNETSETTEEVKEEPSNETSETTEEVKEEPSNETSETSNETQEEKSEEEKPE